MEAKPLPSAPDVEQAILGALLYSESGWPKAADLLRPELFYNEPNRQIYRVARELWAKGHPVDTIAVCHRLRAEQLLDSVGGVHYVSRLTSKVTGSAHLEHHARILIEHHIARRIVTIGQTSSTSALTSADPLALLDDLSVEVSDLYAYTQSTEMPTAMDRITDLTDATPEDHLTFGIHDLDRIAIFQKGLPHVFAGRPGIGKSILSTHIMWHLAQSAPVLLFSPEMTLRQVQSRIIAMECGVAYSTILRGTMDNVQREKVAATIMRIGDVLKNLIVDPTSGISPPQVRARCERAMKMHGIVAFGVDHLHKMSTGDRRTDREETARVSQCMEGLTEIAKNTNLPALVMCQLNREVEKRTDKRPKLSDLKQTGKIEEDAALVVLLYRDGYYQEQPPEDDVMEYSVAKNRDGATGIAKSALRPACNKIESLGLSGFPDAVISTSDTYGKTNANAPF